MVGHILGLGDRHPSNVLFERITDKGVHVDFCNCFEVAMHRESSWRSTFPSYRNVDRGRFFALLVPTHSGGFMPVSGIDGSFRRTCEVTMQVLRANKKSLMAVLEVFVYDPLITWRLVQADVDAR
jgi:serine/threonine-protein kinase mTOR